MTAELTLSHNAQSSRSAILVAAFIVAGIIGASYAYGRSALEATARANAIAIVQENQSFCTGLGFRSEADAYRKCVAGLSEIRLHNEQRLLDEAAGPLWAPTFEPASIIRKEP